MTASTSSARTSPALPASAEEPDSLLITLGAPFYRWQGKLYIEDQSISGLKTWAENFTRVKACSICHAAAPPPGWSEAEAGGITAPTFELVDLPNGYHLPTFLRSRAAVADRLAEVMARCTYRSFAIGGWIGDWGITGAGVARKRGLSHAVWFDRVESQIMATRAEGSLPRKLWGRVKAAITAHNERRALRGADLALLHGRTVFDRLSPFSRDPHIVEDIDLEDVDRISPTALAEKREGAATGPLRLIYVGRADEMKGPLHWVAVLGALYAKGIPFEADWVGDGVLLDQMRAEADRLGIAECITFHGFVSDRPRVLDLMRRAQIMLFCHMTDESPRNLVEALHAATPLLGFADPYASSLVAEQGAGRLVPRGDSVALAEAVATLDADRATLADMIARAGRSARHLTRTQVYRARREIIHKSLGPPKAPIAAA
ncbi:glycosyltransferase [Flavimaricola marinus]|uniref:2-deoxystreptamine N-acetyl-D-glucosaminyltransferase n=1 Tax=Flavimaricola marinus TaxID=1819565 RepID=A0A238LA39_9RHOB|nr:glycosyltransferase [Flavimaricola marinus]SMY06549.1 2-deoxystreptamine N-acetyl-D-glucosaminyltransferase [Flavimaricola marinus]